MLGANHHSDHKSNDADPHVNVNIPDGKMIMGFHEDDFEAEYPNYIKEADQDIPYVYNDRLHTLARQIIQNQLKDLTVICGSEDPNHYMISHVDALWYLANTFFGNTSLQKIHIAYGKDVFADDAKLGPFIANSLVNHPSIEILDLSFDGLTSDTGLYLGRLMLRNTSIRTLNLRGNDFGDSSSTMIRAFSLHQSLRNLDLSHCNLGAQSATQLAHLVERLPKLQELILDGNQFSSSGLSCLLKSIPQSSISELSLSSCGIDDTVAYLLANIIQMKSLKSLYLSANNLGEGSATVFKSVRDTNLEKLYLDNNKLGKLCAVEIGQALSMNPAYLRVLNLSDNNIGTQGSVSLAKSFAFNSYLEELYLGSNNVGSEFGVALGLALKVLSRGEIAGNGLTVLHLPQNSLGNEGVSGLVSGLKEWKGLDVLNLESNNLGNKAAVALASLMSPTHSKVDILNVENNEISEVGRAALADSLQKAAKTQKGRSLSISCGYNLFEELEQPTSEVFNNVSNLEKEVISEGIAFQKEGLAEYVAKVDARFSTAEAESDIFGESDPLLTSSTEEGVPLVL